jgi:hypothetical protein
MKASDLRIGNYICDSAKNIHRITSINDLELCLVGCSIDFRFAEPITLTEEFLINFGFEEVLNSYYKKGFLILNSNFEPIFTDGNYIDEVIGVKIEYVHQLQNLYFALTGEELTLNQEL